MEKKSKALKHYVTRDISWMYFNHRILQEAQRDEVPLLERLSFLGIYSNNLDEFYRVRVATHYRIWESEENIPRAQREAVGRELKQIVKLNALYSKEYEETVERTFEALRKEHIRLVDDTQLDDTQQAAVRSFYRERLNGHIAPLWLSALKHLDNASDENIHLVVKMRRATRKHEYRYAIIELPVTKVGRFVRLPDKDGDSYLMYLDDVVRHCLPLIFAGTNHSEFEAYTLKFTRDAEMEIDNDLRNGIVQKITKGVKSRKRGEPLRVIYDARMPKYLLRRVLEKLGVDAHDTVQAGGRYHNHKDLMRFPDCGRNDLKYPAWPPVDAAGPADGGSLLEQVRGEDQLLHVPYHSFDAYIRLLQEAAIHNEVKSIKTTLYRLAKDSKVAKALITAAHNGKKVTAVVELLARFDETSNIDWSKRMQEAGVDVIFGEEGLKVHSKVTHIGMRTGKDIACISTGNFHEGNARTYTDCLLITAARSIVGDVLNVFRFIERPYSPVRFRELLVSPNEMKRRFLQLLDTEIKNHDAGRPAWFRAKLNHVTDPDMVAKLYEASAHGVPVDLVVRGCCSLVTGVPGVSDTIRVCGIIDRYLEHARIFVFAAGGEEKVFMGSADWMPRNLDSRVEVVTPVYNPRLKEELVRIVDYGLRDNQQGRTVDGTGNNRPWQTADPTPFRSQEELYNYYKKTANEKNEN